MITLEAGLPPPLLGTIDQDTALNSQEKWYPNYLDTQRRLLQESYISQNAAALYATWTCVDAAMLLGDSFYDPGPVSVVGYFVDILDLVCMARRCQQLSILFLA